MRSLKLKGNLSGFPFGGGLSVHFKSSTRRNLLLPRHVFCNFELPGFESRPQSCFVCQELDVDAVHECPQPQPKRFHTN